MGASGAVVPPSKRAPASNTSPTYLSSLDRSPEDLMRCFSSQWVESSPRRPSMSSRFLAKLMRCALYRAFVNLTLASGVASRYAKIQGPGSFQRGLEGFQRDKLAERFPVSDRGLPCSLTITLGARGREGSVLAMGGRVAAMQKAFACLVLPLANPLAPCCVFDAGTNHCTLVSSRLFPWVACNS